MTKIRPLHARLPIKQQNQVNIYLHKSREIRTECRPIHDLQLNLREYVICIKTTARVFLTYVNTWFCKCANWKLNFPCQLLLYWRNARQYAQTACNNFSAAGFVIKICELQNITHWKEHFGSFFARAEKLQVVYNLYDVNKHLM